MRTTILNQEFPDLYKFTLYQGEIGIKDLIKARSSGLSDTDFIETDFRYFQNKTEFGGSNLLNELVLEDKAQINSKGEAYIEKCLSTLFPTIAYESGRSGISYFSSLIKPGGEEIICLLIPEKISKIIASDSKGKEAVRFEFEENEIRDSKVLWIVTSFKEGSPRIVNLSYEAYKGDKNPVRRMSDYVLRNDELTENRVGYTEIDGFLYSSVSGSLIETSKMEDRPIYDMMCELRGDGWNRAKRYSIGDTVRMRDTVFKSVESNNIGNHPYYSRMWVKSDDN